MEHFGQINELAAALSKAQAEMKPAAKDAKNPFFKSTYSSLDSVWESIRIPLSKNGLSVLQPCTVKGASVSVRTWLHHSSGQKLYCGEVTVTATDERPQSVGSALTYCRRYGLGAIGVVSDTDDDGNAGTGRIGSPESGRLVLKSQGPEKLQKARLDMIDAMKSEEDGKKILEQIEKLGDQKKITEAQYDELKNACHAKMAAFDL